MWNFQRYGSEQGFFGACDEESSELIAIACALCHSDGTSRIPGISRDDEASTGGFLYVDSFTSTASEDTKTEALSQALKKAGSEFPDWTLASYIPEGRDKNDRSSEGTRARQEQDARPFLRLGFQQLRRLPTECPMLYITWDRFATFSRLSAASIGGAGAAGGGGASAASAAAAAPAAAPRNAADAPVSSAPAESWAQWEVGIRKLSAEDLNSTRRLHEAAANSSARAISFLIGLGAQVNLSDDNGLSPLMIAAAGRFEKSDQVEVIKALLRNGADIKQMTYDTGLTAFGCFVKENQRMDDFRATFPQMAQVQRPPEAIAYEAQQKAQEKVILGLLWN